MKKAIGVLAVAVALSGALVVRSTHAAEQAQVTELNAATDASIHTHVQALLRGKQAEAARSKPGIRVASR